MVCDEEPDNKIRSDINEVNKIRSATVTS